MVRTVTVTETVTRLSISGPTDTPLAYPYLEEAGGFAPTFEQVALPAFLSTTKFLLTLIAIFIATTFSTYLVLWTKSHILKIYTGREQVEDPEAERATALGVARSVALSHALTVLVLVLRTRQALGSLAPIAYEVFTLMLGIEGGVVVVVGAAWGVVRGMEWVEEERGKKKKGE